METTGSIPSIIRNDAKLYEGTLVYYFRILMHHAQNLHNPYHNLRHILHVLWLCHDACMYYRNFLTAREMRNLLIAAIFHDFNHTGKIDRNSPYPDRVNIVRSIAAFKLYCANEDKDFVEEIIYLIQATEYPHLVFAEDPGLSANILRDADLCQSLSPAWIQQVVFGLAAEWERSPLEVLKMQQGYHEGLNFKTWWAQDKFPPTVVAAKIREAREFIELI